MSPLDLAFVLAAILCIYCFFNSKRKYNPPPGPWNIPFVSGFFTLGVDAHITFKQWAVKYGPLIRTKFGLQDALIIDDALIMKEAFNIPAFNGRMDLKTFTVFSGGKHGILNAEGQEWAEQRRFVLRTLRNFGFGKQSMESVIKEEINDFLKWMKANEGQPTEVHQRLVLATINSLWTMLAGVRHDQDDEMLKQVLKKANEAFTGASGIYIFFPKLIDILPKVFLKDWYLLLERTKAFLQIFEDAVNSHIQNPVDESEPRDLIDAYLGEVKRTTNTESSFYGKRGEETLRHVLSDMYGAGIGTTSALLNWSILYLIRFPQAQKKLQMELDTVIGRNRLPMLSDRPNLPFTEALTMELFRHSSIAPLGLFHETTEDTTLRGYDIKKGTVIIPNVYSMSTSKKVYGDPENFRPERFLSPDGKSVVKYEEFMPFGTGKRQCLGETLGKDNYFLFITSIYQRFEILADPAKPSPSLEPVPGFFLDAQPFTVIFKDRLS